VPLAGPGYDVRRSAPAAPAAAEIWDRGCRAASLSLSEGAVEHDLAWFRRHGAFVVPYDTSRYYLHHAMLAQGLRYELPYQERIKRIGAELGARLHERGITWWDAQLAEYQPLPPWRDFPDIWRATARAAGRRAGEFPFWLLTSRSMQYSWGANVALPVRADVAQHVKGHFGVMLKRAAARRRDIADGELIEIASPTAVTRGYAILREGVRPDVVVVLQQFGHWATPFARDLAMPNLNQVASMDLALTDATGSGADLVPVAIRRVGAPAAAPAPACQPAAVVDRPLDLAFGEMYFRALCCAGGWSATCGAASAARRARSRASRSTACRLVSRGGSSPTWRSARTRRCAGCSCRCSACTVRSRRAFPCARRAPRGSARTGSCGSPATRAWDAATAPWRARTTRGISSTMPTATSATRPRRRPRGPGARRAGS
jgi:hypothetical protein